MSDKKGEENEETEKKATSSRAEPYFEDHRELVEVEPRYYSYYSYRSRSDSYVAPRYEMLDSDSDSQKRHWSLLQSSFSLDSLPRKFRASRTEVDYLNALGQGETKVAYARVMIVGPGGVGKSSLLNGLMNLPLPCEAYSTQVADTFSLRPTESYWACSQEKKYWTKITDADEIKAMAQLIQTILDHKDSNSATGSDVSRSQPSKTAPKFDHPLIEGILKEILSVISTDDRFLEEEVYLHVWDCGGQPIFLKILPAFLTARTLFLLMFDARLDLHDQCRSLTYLKGRATEHLEDISTLDLMVQWISTIHATLLNKRLFFNKERDEEEEVPKYPRILPVGSHGDDISVKIRKHEILEKLSSEITNKFFSDIVLDGAIIDNTTAGKGEVEEDETFKLIRETVSRFATKDLAIRTPITWLLFRKVFQRYARSEKKPVVPLEEVKELCRACLIPEGTLTSILAFYHDLAVFFHYSDIPSLKSCVIADPQWLIKQIARLLALEGREEYRNDHLWKLLREDGILVESLYQEVLSAQKELQPQQIIDLLEHFLIIARISTEKHKGPGLKYFVPSMLPHLPRVDVPHSTSTAINSAIPLHLVFSTNYLPPGFFTQLAAVMSKHPKCYLPVSEKIYLNQIQFLFGSPGQQLDRLFITEEKLSVRIDVQRIDSREYKCPTFISSCHDILEILQISSSDIKKWLPGIDINFALKCEGCPQKDHFVVLPSSPTTSNPSLICQKGNPTKLTVHQKFWFNIRQDHSANTIISSSELEAIAMEVQKCEKVKELAEALEMSEHLEYINNDAMILLEQWQKEMDMMNIPARAYLLHHLNCIGIKDMQIKLTYHKHGSYKEYFEQQMNEKDKEKNEEIDHLKQDIHEKTTEIDHLKEVEKEKNEEIDHLKIQFKKGIGEKNEEIDHLKHDMCEKTTEIERLKELKKDMGEKNEKMKQDLCEKDTEIERLKESEKDVHEKIAEIDHLKEVERGIICKKNEEIDHLKTQFEKGIGEKDEEIDHLKHEKTTEIERFKELKKDMGEKSEKMKQDLCEKDTEIECLKESEKEKNEEIGHLKQQATTTASRTTIIAIVIALLAIISVIFMPNWMPGAADLKVYPSSQGGMSTSECLKPTMPCLLNFPGLKRNINIPNKIGADYSSFGISLLKDETGGHVKAIQKELRGVPVDITTRIFNNWLEGKGVEVSWKSLVKVLNDIGLRTLAEEINETVSDWYTSLFIKRN